MGSGQIPPSQCAQTFQIEQDVIDINIISGVVTCFSCALDSTGPGDVVWLVEMDGNLVPVSTLSNAVADGNFLIIEMPDDFFPPGPSGRRNISCISLVNGQTFEARLVSMGEQQIALTFRSSYNQILKSLELLKQGDIS